MDRASADGFIINGLAEELGGYHRPPYPTDRVFYVAAHASDEAVPTPTHGAGRTRDRSPPARRRWSRRRSREDRAAAGSVRSGMPSVVRTRSRVRRLEVRLSSGRFGG